MSTLDIILLALFIPAVIQGFMKGAVMQVISLASIFIGVWAAYKFSLTVSVWLSSYITADPRVLKIIAFTVIVILAIVLLGMVGSVLAKVMKLAMLGWVDKLLGIVFGVFKAALILGLIVFIFDSFNGKWNLVSDKVLSDSPVYTYLRDFSARFFPYLKSLLTKGNA